MSRQGFPGSLRVGLTMLGAGVLTLGLAVPGHAVSLTGGVSDLSAGVVDDHSDEGKSDKDKGTSDKDKNKSDKKTPKKKPKKKASSPVKSCKASNYWEPQPTANGERFNPNAMTAAHKSLKFNSRVKVTNKSNGKSVTVRINDRGPYVSGRCLDLSRAAMKKIGGTKAGVVAVKWQVL